MKRKTVNALTTCLGSILIASIIPAIFIIDVGLGALIPTLAVIGLVLIYFKNEDARALLLRYLDKFKS